ncbi:MAG TPA: hypothetical protein VFV71_03200 [Burkholderiales bacterium]|nr:hypothetical protein [Burkholderiales bacterium]
MANTKAVQFATRRRDGSMWLAAMALIIAAAGWCSHARAAEPFDRGSVSGSLYLGSGSALGNTYTTFGAGVGYMVSEGLMAGINGELWFGDDPKLQKLTPEIRYIFTHVNPVKPYVGGFFTRTFYEGLDDRNSYGVRGGIYFPFSTNAALSAGLVYEKIMDCDKSVYHDCSQVYPEAGLLVSF